METSQQHGRQSLSSFRTWPTVHCVEFGLIVYCAIRRSILRRLRGLETITETMLEFGMIANAMADDNHSADKR